jgi:hypothetical protein
MVTRFTLAFIPYGIYIAKARWLDPHADATIPMGRPSAENVVEEKHSLNARGLYRMAKTKLSKILF